MKKVLLPFCFALLSVVSACTSPTIDPVAPTETAQVRQARQWLTAQAKWVVNEARENDTVYYTRNVNQVGDGDMQVEWLRFLPDNRLDVKLLHDATVSALYYKIDGVTNELIVSPTADFAKLLNWNTRIDTIHEKSVTLFIQESDDLITLTLIPQP